MLDTGQAVQVPRHEFRVVEEEGGQEKVEISVQLPGVASATEISVCIQPPQTVVVKVPGRYLLELRLAMPIASRADLVKFKPKAGKLTMNCRVTPAEAARLAVPKAAASPGSPLQSAAAAAAAGVAGKGSSSSGKGRGGSGPATGGDSSSGSWSSSDDGTQRPKTPQKQQQLQPQQQKQRHQQRRLQQQQQQAQGQQRPAIHESFFPQPTKAERKRQEEEEQRLRQEQAAAAAAAAAVAAAAAAAEAERQRQEQEAAAAEAARREREEARAAARAARRAEAAAAKAAAAAEEAQRQEQLKRENQAAAKEWLSRGHTAAAHGDEELAVKALQKATELDPTAPGIHLLAKEVNSLRQKAAAASATNSSSGSGSSTKPPGKASVKKQQRPSWQLSMRHDVPGLLSAYAAADHERNAVGWWCAMVCFVCYWVTWMAAAAAGVCAGASSWLQRVPRNRFLRICCAPYSWTLRMCCSVMQRVSTAFELLPLLLLVMWRQAWVSPLNVAARLRRLGGDTQERAAAWLVKQTSSLQHREALLPAAIKLCLAATSGAAVWGAVLCTCAVEYGQHTLMGWVWRLGVWKPHYTLQLLVAGGSSLACFGGQVGACTSAIYPLQILLTAGGRFGAVSLVLSLTVRLLLLQLWRKTAPAQQTSKSGGKVASWWRNPPPWQAVLISVLPAQGLRLLTRTGTWPKFKVGVRSAGSGVLYLCEIVGFWVTGRRTDVVDYLELLVNIVATTFAVLAVPFMLVYVVFEPVGEFVTTLLTSGPLSVLWGPVGAALTALSSLTVISPVDRALLSQWFEETAWPWVVYVVMFVVWPLCSGSAKEALLEDCFKDGYWDDPMTTPCRAIMRAAVNSSWARKALPHSWWFDCLLIAWTVLVFWALHVWSKELRAGRNPAQYWQRRGWRGWSWRSSAGKGASGKGSGWQDDCSESESESDDGAVAEHEYPMGFMSLPVPAGCQVATVRTVLQAANYYQVMGYSSRADVSAESLKTKRRQLVLAVHPDKVGDQHPGANLAASRVNKAFETLSDPIQRSIYDQYLDAYSSSSSTAGEQKQQRGSANGSSSSAAPRGRKKGGKQH